MRAGQLDRRIDIQRFTTSQDAAGEEIKTWTTIARRRAAAAFPLRGDERYTADQFVAKQQIDFRIRYSASLANLNTEDRIIYPAAPEGSPEADPSPHEIFDIIEVSEIGRKDGLKITAVSRAEVRT